MACAIAIAFVVLAAALLAVITWRRPHPNHEYMLDLYFRMLGESSEQGDLPAECARPGSRQIAD